MENGSQPRPGRAPTGRGYVYMCMYCKGVCVVCTGTVQDADANKSRVEKYVRVRGGGREEEREKHKLAK